MTNNFDDYRLEDAEDAAMKNSQMAKRAALGLAGVAAVGGAAYAATTMGGNETDQSISLDPAAGEITEDVLDPAPAPTPAPSTTVHIDNVTIIEGPEITDAAGDPEVEFNDTTLVYDSETGEYLGGYDEGTIDGKNFFILDEDGDGRADIIGYDENGNNIYEENEVAVIDPDTNITIGNGENVAVVTTETPDNDYNPEDYDDMAYNNPDYVNDADVHNDYHQAEVDGMPNDSLADMPDDGMMNDDLLADNLDTTGSYDVI